MTTSPKSAKQIAAMTVAALVLALGFSACNTVEGAGRDVKSVGSSVAHTAEDAKPQH